MKYLLDTCVLSEAFKARPSPSVAAWLQNAGDALLYLSVLTLGEVQKSISRWAKGARIPVADGLIAATASVHGLVLVTRNEKDFPGTGIGILNPWT